MGGGGERLGREFGESAFSWEVKSRQIAAAGAAEAVHCPYDVMYNIVAKDFGICLVQACSLFVFFFLVCLSSAVVSVSPRNFVVVD